MPPPVLAGELKRRCQAAGRTTADVARHLGVPPGTLRNWLHRNAYPEVVLEAVLELLGWNVSLDRLRRRYAFDVVAPRGAVGVPGVELGDVFAAIDARREQLAALFARFDRDVLACFLAMGPDDLFVFTSFNVTPWEFVPGQWDGLGRAAAEAVARGGVCVYVRPGEATLRRFARFGVPPTLTTHTLVEEVRGFRLTVARHLEQAHGQPHREAVRTARDRVLLRLAGDSRFWQPGLSWGYFQTPTAGGGATGRLSVKLPTDFAGILMLPHDYELSARFRQFIERAFEAGPDHLPAGADDVRLTDDQRREVIRRLRGEVQPTG